MPQPPLPIRRPSWRAGLVAVAALALLGAATATAHTQRYPVGGKKLMLRDDGEPSRRLVLFASEKDDDIRLRHDPRQEPSSLLFVGTGPDAGRSELVDLDPTLWTAVQHPKKGLVAWSYWDPQGSRGGVRYVILENGKLTVLAYGERLDWLPREALDSVEVWFKMEDEWFCAGFDDQTSHVMVNDGGTYLARSASPPPLGCREQVCGNGLQEAGEQCDDGNLNDFDSCTSACELASCGETDFDSTFEAIQDVVFEGYGCTDAACHGLVQMGGLDLREGAAYDQLVGVPATIRPGLDRVLPAEPLESFLFQKLAAKTLGSPLVGGTPMPVGTLTVSEPHLQALRQWIRGGAPREGVVEDTAALLGTCLPEETPLKLDPPPAPPAPAEGVQLAMTAWDLPAEFENEICQATFYDFYGTDVIPEDRIVDCPGRFAYARTCSHDGSACESDAQCGVGNRCVTRNAVNPENKCFLVDRLTLIQDPQSHHMLVHVYAGEYGLDHPAWGPWTYKFNDDSHPDQGEACNPLAVDPALGFNPNCSGATVENLACISYGPPDYGNLGSIVGQSGNAPTIITAQEAYLDLDLPPGVYDFLPMRGVVAWNSHAFNLTSFDSTMNAYFNIEFAEPEQSEAPVVDIFDAGSIFVQEVPPFQTREYCRTWTIPRGGHLFRLSTHVHRTGVLSRVWAPPNEPCEPPCPSTAGGLFCSGDTDVPTCAGPRPSDEAIYYSTEYNDPLQLFFDPPIVHDEESVEDRTYLYCALYDNGSTPSSPRVKRQSTSPQPPAGIPLGGPCVQGQVACANEGPMKGRLCRGDDRLCDSAPGVLDGDCDACPVTGGVTTEDEMFVLFGSWYCGEGECPNDNPLLGGDGVFPGDGN